jgi:ferredoxin
MSTHEKSAEPSPTTPSEKVKVTINGISGEVDTGKTLLEAADDIGAGLMHLCFGNGLCSTCRVEIVDGEKSLSPKEIKERICLDYRFCFDPNTRLACQAKVQGPVEVAAPKPFSTFAPKPKKKK